MSIEINNESEMTVDEARVLRLATFALDQMRIHPAADLGFQFVGEDVMEKLHIDWMDEPGPTDVLSFPMDELRPGTEAELSAPGLLGDIVICPSVAAAQAQEAGHEFMDEVLLLATHGILHLLGFDHAEEFERLEMFTIQDQILEAFYKVEAA